MRNSASLLRLQRRLQAHRHPSLRDSSSGRMGSDAVRSRSFGRICIIKEERGRVRNDRSQDVKRCATPAAHRELFVKACVQSAAQEAPGGPTSITWSESQPEWPDGSRPRSIMIELRHDLLDQLKVLGRLCQGPWPCEETGPLPRTSQTNCPGRGAGRSLAVTLRTVQRSGAWASSQSGNR